MTPKCKMFLDDIVKDFSKDSSRFVTRIISFFNCQKNVHLKKKKISVFKCKNSGFVKMLGLDPKVSFFSQNLFRKFWFLGKYLSNLMIKPQNWF